MKVFSNPDDIDLDFVKNEIRVEYSDSDYFSPVKIIDRLAEIDKAKKESI